MSDQPIMQEKPLFAERAINFLRQFVLTLLMHQDAYHFIRQYQPWKGLQRYGWTLKALIIVAALIGWRIFKSFYDVISDVVAKPQAFNAGITTFFSSLSFEKFGWMLNGSHKYLVLIVLEIVTFHFVQHVLEIRTGRPPDHSIKAFIGAEKRMIVVSLVAWIAESIVQGLVNIPIGLLGFDFLKKPAGLVIQFFFLGFTLIDTYHECFDLRVTESRKRTWQVAGVAVATGLVAYLLMFIPLVGVVAATMLGAVVATMAMERFHPVTVEEVAAWQAQRAARRRKKQD